MKTCHYYVTLNCNDACEFCRVWTEKEQFQETADHALVFKELRIRGGKKLFITGGEPLLRADLPDILRQARRQNFWVGLMTNGILYQERGKELKGLADAVFFALDYPTMEEHDRSRGVECYSQVIPAIEFARGLGENVIIQFTMTRDSVRFLPEMVDLAQKMDVYLNLSPVYDFYGTQGFKSETLDYILYYAKRKKVLVNRAAIEFVKQGGNNLLLPRCRAEESTLTVMPDGEFVAPCFYNRGGRQGREAVCSSCMRWPYMLPSFSQRVDRYYWLGLYSRFDAWRKGVNL
ncbi:MAG: radical SAM protein [Candidatus Margulisiibacteriota bacterium]|jgi:MoaA/NifB/PqqE/SkfB family radical SAM enzyme